LIQENNMVVVNIPVTFTDTSTGNISVSWDFGDPTPIVTGSPVSHTFSSTGTFRVTATITSSTGENKTCYQDVVVTSVATGTLDLSSIPPGAEIIIDSTYQGKVTPQIIKNIPVGTHSLKLTLSGYQDYNITFTINAGLVTVLKPTLTSISPPSGAGIVVGAVAVVGAAAVIAYFVTQTAVSPVVIIPARV
jgi:PKD repeat protein